MGFTANRNASFFLKHIMRHGEQKVTKEAWFLYVIRKEEKKKKRTPALSPLPCLQQNGKWTY
jgi:uncharacterized Zn finger protein